MWVPLSGCGLSFRPSSLVLPPSACAGGSLIDLLIGHRRVIGWPADGELKATGKARSSSDYGFHYES